MSRQIYSLHQKRDLCQLYGTPQSSLNTELYESFCQAQHFLPSRWKTTEKGHKWADKIRRSFLPCNKDGLILIMLRSPLAFLMIFLAGPGPVNRLQPMSRYFPCVVIITSRRHAPSGAVAGAGAAAGPGLIFVCDLIGLLSLEQIWLAGAVNTEWRGERERGHWLWNELNMNNVTPLPSNM